MNIKITYPAVPKQKLQRDRFLKFARWPVAVAAVACPLINYCTGGKAWSVVVLMGLYMLWTLVLSPDLVQYNRISQFIKFITCSCVLLVLIDIFLSSGWAVPVVPLVCSGGLIVSGFLFFTDLEKQKQNISPLLLLAVLSLIGAGIALAVWQKASHWSIVALGAVSLALFIGCIIVLGSDFLRELRRHFHTK